MARASQNVTQTVNRSNVAVLRIYLASNRFDMKKMTLYIGYAIIDLTVVTWLVGSGRLEVSFLSTVFVAYPYRYLLYSIVSLFRLISRKTYLLISTTTLLTRMHKCVI